MGDWNNPVIVPAPAHRPSLWESTIAPSLTQVLGNLALAKVQHGWQMDVADRQIAAQQVATKQEQSFKAGESALDRASTEKNAARGRNVQMVGHMMNYAATTQAKPPTTLEGLLVQGLAGKGASTQEIVDMKERFKTDKDFRTALQKNIPYLADTLKIPEQKAAEILVQSKGKSEEAVYIDLYGKALTATFGDQEEAEKMANKGLETYRTMFGKKGAAAGKKVVNTGVAKAGPYKGRKVNLYDDGTISPVD